MKTSKAKQDALMVSHNLKTISKKGAEELEQTLKTIDDLEENGGVAEDKSRYRDLVFKRHAAKST